VYASYLHGIVLFFNRRQNLAPLKLRPNGTIIIKTTVLKTLVTMTMTSDVENSKN